MIKKIIKISTLLLFYTINYVYWFFLGFPKPNDFYFDVRIIKPLLGYVLLVSFFLLLFIIYRLLINKPVKKSILFIFSLFLMTYLLIFINEISSKEFHKKHLQGFTLERCLTGNSLPWGLDMKNYEKDGCYASFGKCEYLDPEHTNFRKNEITCISVSGNKPSYTNYKECDIYKNNSNRSWCEIDTAINLQDVSFCEKKDNFLIKHIPFCKEDVKKRE